MSTSSRREAKRSSGSNPPSHSRRTGASARRTPSGRSNSSGRTSRRSAPRGKSGSAVEAANVSTNGFWLFIDDREVFLPFDRFPWFREGSVGAITRVERPRAGHLHRPDRDVDLAVESIEHPERSPLSSRLRSSTVSDKRSGRLHERAGGDGPRSRGDAARHVGRVGRESRPALLDHDEVSRGSSLACLKLRSSVPGAGSPRLVRVLGSL